MTSLIRYGLLAVALSTGGCGGSDDSGSDGRPGGADAGPTVDSPPAATIAVSVAPFNPGGIKADGTILNGMNITITVTNFTLTNPFAGDARIANAEGHGGYALYFDASTTVLVTDYRPNIQVAVPQTTSQGSHTLRVQGLQNDGTPVSPALTGTSLTFMVLP